MSNPIFQQYGAQGGSPNMLARFEQFRKNFTGNPQQIVQNMLNSGRITQDELNAAIKTANEFMKMVK